jgi:phosphatidylserine decarboxylase
LSLRVRHVGPRCFPCAASFVKGREMGWFEHGSTIIVLAPRRFALCAEVASGHMVRVGQPLMRRPP